MHTPEESLPAKAPETNPYVLINSGASEDSDELPENTEVNNEREETRNSDEESKESSYFVNESSENQENTYNYPEDKEEDKYNEDEDAAVEPEPEAAENTVKKADPNNQLFKSFLGVKTIARGQISVGEKLGNRAFFEVSILRSARQEGIKLGVLKRLILQPFFRQTEEKYFGVVLPAIFFQNRSVINSLR